MMATDGAARSSSSSGVRWIDPYADRAEAGRRLVPSVRAATGAPVRVVGVSPGGIAVAYELARGLDTLLEVSTGPHRVSMRNHTVVLVDDGLASAADLLVAVAAIRQEKPHRIVVALPIARRATLDRLDPYVDGVVCLFECPSREALHTAYADGGTPDPSEVPRLVEQRRHERESLRPPPPRR